MCCVHNNSLAFIDLWRENEPPNIIFLGFWVWLKMILWIWMIWIWSRILIWTLLMYLQMFLKGASVYWVIHVNSFRFCCCLPHGWPCFNLVWLKGFNKWWNDISMILNVLICFLEYPILGFQFPSSNLNFDLFCVFLVRWLVEVEDIVETLNLS